MNVIARGRQDFLLLIELCDLLCQQGRIRPARSVSIRNPSCPQITEAVDEKFHVLWARPFAEQVRNRERSSEQSIAAGDLVSTLCDDREGHIPYDCGQFIRR